MKPEEHPFCKECDRAKGCPWWAKGIPQDCVMSDEYRKWLKAREADGGRS
ncbi:MAG: hypothetical protein PF636_08860 [Actinomycetota bacterium]|jgi:hypothetical protein|nr:hypothetical protein [Actinomycetota bacterium]